jgi:CheY-like chemotaxis protein
MSELATSGAAMAAARILVVEDDPGLRELLVTALSEHGYAVFAAEDSSAALSLLDREPVELVLTDMHLPGMDGHALIDALCARHPTVGTVVFTGFASDQSEALARQQQVLAYLRKPLSDLKLIGQAVDSALESNRKRRGTT